MAEYARIRHLPPGIIELLSKEVSMRSLRHIIRKVTLYVSAIVLIGAVPLTAFADDSDACAGTGHWSDRWKTDPITQQCVKVYDSDGTFVGPSYMAPQPTPTPTPEASPSPSPSVAPSTDTTPQTTVQDTGSNNTTGASTTTNGTANTDVTNTTNVTSGVQSASTSGNATVQGNTSSGNATSGSADTNGTVVNSVHSTVAGGSGVATFTYDVNGNVVGDITLSGNGNQATASNATNLNGTTNVNNKTSLNNDVDLSATSGNATVQGNESTGSATTGNANAVANILNLINTIIAANQSFVGTINIYGNLDGDILLSPEFIPQLLASNGGSVASSNNLALTMNTANDSQIVNNVNLNATTGSATVSGSESKGSATTGSAQTNLTILNLTGHQVTAANSLLVFVNVLGTWVGMIIDAPGATAAMLGSGVVSDTTNVSNVAKLANASSITNNVNVTAASGNATVRGNESTGSATSGNATASANIANISTSTFNLTGWFGVLYINVFGKWLGSFGVNTAVGTIQPLTGMAVPDKSATIAAPNLHFGFMPRNDGLSSSSIGGITASDNSNDDGYRAAVMASAIASKKLHANSPQQTTLLPIASPHEDPFSVIMMIGGFGVAGTSAVLWAARRLLEARMARFAA